MFFSKKPPPPERPAPDPTPSRGFVFILKALLVVDGSPLPSKTTTFALNFALQSGCELLATYIVDTATLDYLQQLHIVVQDERDELEQDLTKKGRCYLDGVVEQCRAAGVTVSTQLCSGRFHQAILHIAREQQVDIIIIGGWKNDIRQKDTTSVERQLFMDLAECPVIVVKSKPEPASN